MSTDEFSGRSLPLAVGVARGVRAFDVDKQGRLLGVTFRKPWRPGENVAQCFRGDWVTVANQMSWAVTTTANYYMTGKPGRVQVAASSQGLTPNTKPHGMESCGHGFYAYYDGSNDYRTDSRISGVVEAYGECLIGTRGFRASNARIVALHLREDRPVRQWLKRWGATVVAATLAGLFGGAGILAITVLSEGRGWVTVGAGFVWLLLALWEGLKTRRIEAAEGGVSPELLALVRRNYPDVPVFSSFEAMVRVFPPDKSLASTPESDDEFWERAS